MLQMMGAFAEFERSLIRERSIAGQRAAKAKGAILGRPRRLIKASESEIVEQYVAGRGTLAQLANLHNVSLSVVKRAVCKATKPHSSCLR